jgi:hypothetical protein
MEWGQGRPHSLLCRSACRRGWPPPPPHSLRALLPPTRRLHRVPLFGDSFRVAWLSLTLGSTTAWSTPSASRGSWPTRAGCSTKCGHKGSGVVYWLTSTTSMVIFVMHGIVSLLLKLKTCSFHLASFASWAMLMLNRLVYLGPFVLVFYHFFY